MSKNIGPISIVILLLLVGGVIVFLSKNNTSSSPSPSPSISKETNAPSINNEEVDNLRRGGSSYSDPNGVYTFLYPNDYTLDTQNNGKDIRIYKQGPTQKGQTEMYDGVILVFQTINLNGKTLSNWVDQNIKEIISDGTSQIVEPKVQTPITKYPGFSYGVRSLGVSRYVVVQKDANSKFAVSISMLVEDPKIVGFQKQVDAILSTLELLK